ncbi:MAG: TonB-dependent receptor, partial [Acidobacteriota bacterium]|nr:TonB-dependent receptor [Acidobacteriota bacterium]
MKLLAGLLTAATLLLAQVDTGSVAGLITDASGAVVPEASVIVSHVETNTQTALKSNGSGYYSVPSLRPGRYLIEVSKEGFRPQKSQEFELRVQDRAELNFRLQLGAASSEITVIATAPLLESETSSLGQVVEEKTITELPLNGRNFIQLATLGAGTLPSTRTAERDNFIANGARAIQNSYLLDGVDNKNRIFGFDKSSAQIIQPIIDAIQEFKVQTATFSAEFGQAAGGVVNVTLKSGTNAFHGNLFEFMRNSRLDASPYFQSAAGGGKPLFIQNQFGATFGGPIVKSRTFFFASWQSSREVNAAPQIASVPTAAQHQGIFMSTVRDPVTKAPFQNNTIPVGRFDPVAARLLALYPLPNLSGATRNYSSNPKERITSDQYNLRVDHQISPKDSMFGRFSQSYSDNALPNLLPDPANTQGAVHPDARSLALSETHTFSSNKVNEFRFGYAFTHIQQDVDAERLFDQFGIKGALNEPKIKGLPQFTITSFTTLGTTTPGNIPIAATGSGNFPSEKSGKIYQLLDNFSWIHARHTIRFGVDLQRVTMYAYATNNARPLFAFNGTYTGNALGDFLLGYVFNANTSQQQLDTIIQHIYQGYIQDDWKVTPKLTLNAGMRYELPAPFVEEYDRQS